MPAGAREALPDLVATILEKVCRYLLTLLDAAQPGGTLAVFVFDDAGRLARWRIAPLSDSDEAAA